MINGPEMGPGVYFRGVGESRTAGSTSRLALLPITYIMSNFGVVSQFEFSTHASPA